MATKSDLRVLDGKVAVVTGASAEGIGGATARRLAGSGATLFLTSTEPLEDQKRIVADCIEAGIASDWVQCRRYDFTAHDSADRMVADAIASYGRIDILINNAGMRNRKPFGSFARVEFDEMIAVNLRAPFLASQAVVPHMRRQGGGRIVHVASQMGLVTAPDLSLYSITKAGLISLTRSMALELSLDGIAVNAVSPGPIMSGFQAMRLRGKDEERAALAGMVPLGRFGTPDEVAEVIHFLATSDGTFIQGENLVVDGGYVIH